MTSARERPIDEWAKKLSIGLVAHALGSESQPGQAQFRNNLRAALLDLLAEVGAERDPRLRSLPLSTLRALTRSELVPHLPVHPNERQRWREALKFVGTSRKDGAPPLLSSARLLAHLLLDGHCSSGFFIRCGTALISDNWKWAEREPGWKASADVALAKLRARPGLDATDTFTRIDALEDFQNAVPKGGARSHWDLVENAVFQQLFAWPLLVNQCSSVDGGYSIPVAVDVVFDGKGQLYVSGALGPEGPINALAWRRELGRAMQVAKHLWRSKHGGSSLVLRETVESASVSFDFRLAEQIVSATPFELDLFQASMGPYFSQIVLHRLLGRSHGFGCAITGLIGDRRRSPETGQPTLDYEFKSAEEVGRKLRYVFATQSFSKVVLPDDRGEDERNATYIDAATEGGFTEVNYCHYLSNVADAVQPNGWRQHHYVRCPDVLRLIHLRPQELPEADDAGVRAVGRLLSQHRDAVLRLPASVRALDLAAYLQRANTTDRDALKPFTPASLSWTFVRATEDENDRRLWQTIWATIGGSREDFAQFRHATSATQAAAALSEAMNTFSPRETCLGHRAPDLLVILGARRLEPSAWKSDVLSYRSHLFPAVIDAAQRQEILPTPVEGMRQFIGHTRIIILNDGEREIIGRTSDNSREVGAESHRILQRLCTFRFGFSQQMAGLLLSELGYGGLDVRRALSSLLAAGHLREAGGQYWVAGNLGDDNTGAWPLDVHAERHWAAAMALAPYLAPDVAPGLDLAEPLLPQNVHEAGYHLEVAGERANDLSRTFPRFSPDWQAATRMRRQIRIAHSRLLRFVDLPSPGMVLTLSKEREGLSSRSAWEMAIELLAEKAALGLEPSAQELTLYAQGGARWLDDVRDDPNVRERWAKTRVDVLSLFDDAVDKTQHDPSTPSSSRLSVLSHYGHFLVRHGDREAHHPWPLSRVRHEVARLIEAGVRSSSVNARWFEVEGDRHENPADAAAQYQLSTMMAPKWYPCWVKLAGARPEGAALEIQHELFTIPGMVDDEPGIAGKISRWASAQDLPINTGLELPWVCHRWNAGVLVFAEVAQSA